MRHSTQFGWRASRVQLHVRSALVTAVSRRTLTMRASELSAYSTGAVTNMMSEDVQKVRGRAVALSTVNAMASDTGVAVH